ncbi:hypothetical protein McpSp1_14090 [Methanocorpusculaceae archaeon Sp1]|nr:hypothetical protein [Methanocorpusculaceae archaeon Sp1]
MTKVLGICGSAAPKSSTKKLIEAALDAAKTAGAEVEFIDAAKMNIHGCKGCLACKADQAKLCTQKDDMTPLYAKINAADAIIIGSPIYFGENTGQIKCFIDRLYAFIGPEGSRMKPGIKTAAIITQGYDDEKAYVQCANTLVGGFSHLGATAVEPLIVGSLHTADDLKPESLAAAKTLGKKLAE